MPTRLGSIFILWVSVVVSTTAVAQSEPKRPAERPVAILNPAHGDFVIPPFVVEGIAEPGERLGLFVNGYPQKVVTADAKGHFSYRVAWTHDGPLWLEVRRGDTRRHAIHVTTADVAPAISDRRLAAESEVTRGAPGLLRSESVDSIWSVKAPAERRSASRLLEMRLEEPSVGTRSSERGEFDRRMVAELGVGYLLQGTAIPILLSDRLRHNQEFLVSYGASMMIGQAFWTYLVEMQVEERTTFLNILVGTALPTLAYVAGALLGSTEVMVAGLAMQPLGAVVGARF